MALLGAVLAAIFSPILCIVAVIVLAIEDVCFRLFGGRRERVDTAPRHDAATVVIPNWNGRDLLERFLPSVVDALAGHPQNEIIVVDNASSDGSVEFLRQYFPVVRVLALGENLGFGGGSNAGFAAAKNEIVVLLNNDMRVEPDFLAPLLVPFSDPLVFSVSCQIFFSDPAKRREETGLTETWWERGRLRVSHRDDPEVNVPFPCAYPGGGSSAFDRRKFTELGGFDELFRPFYYEDTALGHLAWKRGWKVFYQPRSIVFHEHRGTIGRKFSAAFIQGVVRKNLFLYIWKNIHDWRMLLPHFADTAVFTLIGTMAGSKKGLYSAIGLGRAVLSLPEAVRSRWRARELARIDDLEAFRRQRGAYFRDRFETTAAPPERLRVLFASPYPIEPPVHGGAVFMQSTLAAMQPFADVHLLSFVDEANQLPAQDRLRDICSSAAFFVRQPRQPRNLASLAPHVIHEFFDPEFAWAVDRTVFLKKVDVVQIEYTILSQYAGSYYRIPTFLFEHDISFQSLARTLKRRWKPGPFVAYMQLLRYETKMARKFTRVQVCSRENEAYLLQFAPELRGRIDPDLRAVIDTGKYQFVTAPREPQTMLFVGSMRHRPNLEALLWFIEFVFPAVLAADPAATLVVAGAGSWDAIGDRLDHPKIRQLGFVSDVRELFDRYASFICPILSGSGVRVKLLEAFASGIPVVSTTLGAEGLAAAGSRYCELADQPEDFARAVVTILQDPVRAEQMAARAREMVEREKDASCVTRRLVEVYRREVWRLRDTAR